MNTVPAAVCSPPLDINERRPPLPSVAFPPASEGLPPLPVVAIPEQDPGDDGGSSCVEGSDPPAPRMITFTLPSRR
eukprot:CAMPEP_0174833296 /NCGR_PEP_ID=MMETSP1114-20130205/4154_1 /TAXON_ID=312471 /ORGANISM="Neobodo designis, Strain CCAP 1951/1" /LENGTH=75 /DNA_ID=CAMNT_0016067171 /DNA_START=133 /DNA_END=357 /DNA_ORIENTATION=+